jgi:hypothetical protein
MDEDPSKTDESNSDANPAGGIIEEVIKSIESVDRTIEAFFAIHGTELQTSREIHSNSRRGK